MQEIHTEHGTRPLTLSWSLRLKATHRSPCRATAAGGRTKRRGIEVNWVLRWGSRAEARFGQRRSCLSFQPSLVEVSMKSLNSATASSIPSDSRLWGGHEASLTTTMSVREQEEDSSFLLLMIVGILVFIGTTVVVGSTIILNYRSNHASFPQQNELQPCYSLAAKVSALQTQKRVALII